MPTSQISICNRALQILGSESIINIVEDNNRARALTIAYDAVRMAELRRNKWRFAIKRTSVPALSDAPDSDYRYAYELPVDWLRLIPGGDIWQASDLTDYRGGAGSATYEIEGRTILTNLTAPLKLRYMWDVTDTSLFDATFAESFANRLAFEICERITQSDSKKQVAWGGYRTSIREASKINAIEGAAESIADDTWVTARIQ